jgi:NAD(P)-dependent dehydrogenase (short-subunit alcohol dehydrogenase family)
MGRRFLTLGGELIICGRRAEVLATAACQLLDDVPGAHVSTHVCDIRDGEGVEAMMQAIWEVRPLDILVNNAAATFIAQTHRLSHRAADAVLSPTLHGALYCTLSAGRRWIEGGHRGVVLSILSTSPITGRAFTVSSAMAKAGVLAMTKSLAVEWGPHGVRLVALAPGPFPTEGSAKQLGVTTRGSEVQSRNPLGRNGDPAELANLASFLVSDGASFINGEMVVIDGGQHLRTSGAEDLLAWSEEQWAAMRRKM